MSITLLPKRDELGVTAGRLYIDGHGVMPTTGEALITHPGVDKISFTGSRAVGQHILSMSGDGVKRVSLELGGKSASINFADAPDVGLAAITAMAMVSMGLSGQGCVIQSRALVERTIYTMRSGWPGPSGREPSASTTTPCRPTPLLGDSRHPAWGGRVAGPRSKRSPRSRL